MGRVELADFGLDAQAAEVGDRVEGRTGGDHFSDLRVALEDDPGERRHGFGHGDDRGEAAPRWVRSSDALAMARPSSRRCARALVLLVADLGVGLLDARMASASAARCSATSISASS